MGSLKGLTKFENSHGELYSFVHKKWWLFDQLEFRLPLAERSSYLLMITIESHLGVLVRTSQEACEHVMMNDQLPWKITT